MFPALIPVRTPEGAMVFASLLVSASCSVSLTVAPFVSPRSPEEIRSFSTSSRLPKWMRCFFYLRSALLVTSSSSDMTANSRTTAPLGRHQIPSADTTLTEKTWNLIYESLATELAEVRAEVKITCRKASALDFWMYFSCVALFVIKNEEEPAWHSAVWQNTGSSRNISEYFNGWFLLSSFVSRIVTVNWFSCISFIGVCKKDDYIMGECHPKSVEDKLTERLEIHAMSLNPSCFHCQSDQLQISPLASPEITHHTVWTNWFVAHLEKVHLIWREGSEGGLRYWGGALKMFRHPKGGLWKNIFGLGGGRVLQQFCIL